MIKIVHLSDIHWRGISRHTEYVAAFNLLFKKLKEDTKPDLIVNCGDFFHTKTQGITPEIIEKLSWCFNSLADIAPTISILGNHDGNLNNTSRQDIITPIHEAIKHPQAFLYKKSGCYPLKAIHPKYEAEPDTYFHVYSPFDIDGWNDISPVEGAINIALFHGSIVGCEIDTNFRMYHCERDVSFFKGMDYVLLGDIHRAQFLDKRADKFGLLKPYIGYCGSLLQQNHGEQEQKGFLVWTIQAKDDWNIEFAELENLMPFITVPWMGTASSTVRNIKKTKGDRAFLPGTRYRITSSLPIQQIEARQIINELREHHQAGEIAFKCDQISKIETVETANVKVLKTDLRHDHDAVFNLYREYSKYRPEALLSAQNYSKEAEPIIRSYLHRLNTEEPEASARNVAWSIKSIEFDNIFCYGENNSINFEDLNGIVGIFGPNRSGKSTCVAALMYSLFNTTDRGPMKAAHIINKLKKTCAGKIRISVAGHEYLIERETQRSGPRNSIKREDIEKTITSLNLYKVEPSGDLLEMNSVTRDDTDKEIRKLIGTSSDFLLTAFSNQGGANRFIEEGATQRKIILSRFLDLDIFEKLNIYVKDDYSTLEEKTRRYYTVDWSEAIKKLKDEISFLESKLSKLLEVIHVNTTNKDELRLWISEHTKLVTSVNPDRVKELKLNIESHKNLIKDLEKQYNTVKKTKVNNEVELEKTEQKLSTYDIVSLTRALTEIDNLKSIIGDYSKRLSVEDLTLKTQRKTLKSLSFIPCGEQYPNCHFIADSVLEKQKIPAQEKLVKELEVVLNTNRELLEKYAAQRINEQINDARVLEKHYFELKTGFEITKSKIFEITRNLLDAQKELKLNEEELEELQKKRSNPELKWLERKKEDYVKLVKEIEQKEKEQRDLLVKLGGKTEQLNNLINEQSECETTLVKLRLYDSIQNAFSKNGIPAMVLKTQLPAINAELSKILGNVVDFKVILETDTSSNIMDVYIEDGNSRRIIELASGMEKMISSLALRVALLNLSSLPRPDVLIIDEGWGALDQENLIKVSVFLESIRPYFKTILIISHIQEIKETCERILEIKSDGLESSIKE